MSTIDQPSWLVEEKPHENTNAAASQAHVGGHKRQSTEGTHLIGGGDRRSSLAAPSKYTSSNTNASSTRPRAPTNSDTEAEDSDTCCGSLCDPVLWWFRIYHFFAGVSSLSTIPANLLVISSNFTLVNIRDIGIRSFGILFALLLVCAEMDWRYVVRRFKLLDAWVWRGLLFFYLGMLTIDGSDVPIFNIVKPENISGTIECGFGICYIIFAMFDLRSVEIHKHAYHRERALESSIFSV